ncbi:MAG: tetratricopeptide repeat protein [Planctomycetota bacterium]|nr:MAG: tetratricopeptide repeat protein [Planctomycetota bacterium]
MSFLPPDYEQYINEAYESHNGDVYRFLEEILAMVESGLPEPLLVAVGEILEKETDPVRSANLRLLIGRLRMKKQDYRNIIPGLGDIHLDESLPGNLRCCAYWLHAQVHVANADADKALDCCRKGLEISSDIEDRTAVEILNTTGVCYFHLEQYEDAIRYFEKYIQALEDIGDTVPSKAYNNIAVNYSSLGESKASIDAYKKALAIEKKNRNPRSIAIALSNLAGHFLTQNNPESALEYSENAFDMLEDVEDNFWRSQTLINLTQSNLLLEKYDDAMKTAEQAVFIANSSQRVSEIADAMLTRAIVFAKLGKPDAADAIEKAVIYFESNSVRSSDFMEMALFEWSKLVDPDTSRRLLLKAKRTAESRSHIPLFQMMLDKVNAALSGHPGSPAR